MVSVKIEYCSVPLHAVVRPRQFTQVYAQISYDIPKKALRAVLYLFFKRLEAKPPC
jgi:hypothetical protein